MKYLEFTFTTTPASDVAEDILSDLLAGIGFDSFVRPDALEWEKCPGSENPESPEFQVLSGEDLFKAYIQTDAFDSAALDEVIAAFPLPDVEVSYTMCEAEDKDWNEEWEKLEEGEIEFNMSKKEYKELLEFYRENYDNLTPEEKENINRQIGQYNGQIVKDEIERAEDAVKKTSERIPSIVEGFISVFKK